MLILFLFAFISVGTPYYIYAFTIRHSRHDRTQFRLQSNIEISRIDVLGVLDGNVDLQRRR